MNISVLSVFPSLYDSFLQTSLIRRAQEKELVTFDMTSFFSYVAPKERIDAPTFGHGAGMLIRPDVVEKAIEDKERLHGKAVKVFFSPHGTKLDQNVLKRLAVQVQAAGHLILVPARYEGMDARAEQVYADELISVGDFVLMGGDLPAMIFLEGLLRLFPGVVGKQESIEEESFSGPFVDYPEFTAPVEWKGLSVPEILRSGNHGAIRAWRVEQAVNRSILGHFEWLRSTELDAAQKKLVAKVMPNHYVALSHTDVFVGRTTKEVGNTSVTSIDIHDIARSSATYGIQHFFIVTPLVDQQKIVARLLDFWQKGIGIEYNKIRYQAVKSVTVVNTIDDVIAEIEKKEGRMPVVVATSAQKIDHKGAISFYDQKEVWERGNPVLLLFGTGQGLTDERIAKCDFLLPPVEGFSEFNHLSVRSATAAVLDRWLGINIR